MASAFEAEPDTLATIRRLLLALVILGSAGFLAELLLLEHIESVTQWIPIVLLAAGLLTAATLALSPTCLVVRAFRATMGLIIASGLLGLYLHYTGNLAFEREMDASAGGLALIWQSVRGATPALAPGALVLLGLLGLIQAHRHPACTGRS